MDKREIGKKKVWIALVTVAVVLAAAVVVVLMTTNKQAYRTVSVIEVSGKVGVMRDGVEYSAYPGMMLQEGHEIVTSADSFVRLVLDADKYVKLEEDSKLTFETLGVVGSGKTRLNLECGALTTELINSLTEEEEYVVNTPNAVLAVRGTFFRVDIRREENGEVVTDVKTYGGAVASKRIMPDGAIVEEDVLIASGFKTSIKKDDVITVYMVEGVERPVEPGANTQENTEPIVKEEISDGDLIDIYFAVKNGHDLFTTAEEVKEVIEARKIDIEQETSVYEKAQKVLETPAEPEVATESELPVEPEISAEPEPPVEPETSAEPEPPVEPEAPTEPEPPVESETSTEPEPLVEPETSAEPEQPVEPETPTAPEIPTAPTPPATPTPPVAPEPPTEPEAPTEPETPEAHVHQYDNQLTTPPTCTEKGVRTYICTCGDSYTEDVDMTDHREILAGTELVHSKCGICGEPMSNVHNLVESTVQEPTCTEKGKKVFACECEYSYSEEIDATGHTEVKAGLETVHSKCGTCGVPLADGTGHDFTETEYEGNCLYNGILRHTCDCGYTYDTERPLGDHTPSYVGQEDIHTWCGVCGITLEDGSAHSFSVVREEPTCTMVGMIRETCDCGYVRETPIPKTDHNWEFVGSQNIHRQCSTCDDAFEYDSYHAFEERVVTPATCTVDGEMLHECECGYSYTTIIVKTGHAEVGGGEAEVHTKCGTCGEVILDGNYHSMGSHITSATCTTDGLQTESCSCGYVKNTVLPATGHVKYDEYSDNTYCRYCGQPWIEINTMVFADDVLTNYIATNFDTDGDGKLFGDEVFNVTAIDVSGTPDTDGGISSLFGLNVFPNLTTLDCSYNVWLPDISSSGCTHLTTLNCSNTGLTSLEGLSSVASTLVNLAISNNAISNVELAGFTSLQSFTCKNTQIGNITLNGSSVRNVDLSENASLTQVTAEGMMYLEGIVMNDCPSLQSASIWGNDKLTNIVMKRANSLLTFNATENPTLGLIDLTEGATTLGFFNVTDSATDGQTMYVEVTGDSIDISDIIGWNNENMSLVNYTP